MTVAADPKGYYRTLGVTPEATAEAIRTAYRRRAKLLHPDGGGTVADVDFQELVAAYEVLRDPRRRLEYDADNGVGASRPRGADAGGREDATQRRGERPQRSAPPPKLFEPPATVTLWAVILILGLLVAVGGGVIWRMRGQLEAQAAVMAGQDSRYAELAAVADDLRGRHLAQTVARIDGDGPMAAASGRTLFSKEIAFQPGSATLDRPLEVIIDNAVVELSRALRLVPDEESWLVVVEGYAARAAAEDGVAVDAWEIGLLRVGAVIDRLLAQGLPANRMATQFQAGFSDQREPTDTPVVELKLVCCLR